MKKLELTKVYRKKILKLKKSLRRESIDKQQAIRGNIEASQKQQRLSSTPKSTKTPGQKVEMEQADNKTRKRKKEECADSSKAKGHGR